MYHNLHATLPPCRIAPSTKEQLQRWADRHQMSLSTAVRQAILRLLADELIGTDDSSKSEKGGMGNE